MKIGIDARLWNETGVGRYIRNLVSQLQKLDQKNSYVLFVLPKDKHAVEEGVINKEWKVVDVNIRWHSLEEQFQFTSLLNKAQLDLMHFPYFSLPIRYNKPFVVTIHDLIIYHFPTGKASTLPFPLYHIKQQGYRLVLSHATAHAKKILVPLNTVKEDVIKSFHVPEKNVIVTREGFDASIIAPQVKPSSLSLNTDAPYFLYVGNAYPHKNVETIVEAFTELRETDTKSQLVIVGKEDYFTKETKSHVPERIQADVHFIHDADDKTLGYLYANAKALLSASQMEGFGLPALEAAAVGCLLVLSDIPAYKENWEGAALFFNPKKPQELCETLRDILNKDKKTYDALIQKAKSNVKMFSWETMAKETLTVYEDSNRL